MDRSDINHGFTTFKGTFIIFRKATIAIKPGKSALNNPTAREKLKAFDPRVSRDNLKHNVQIILNPVNELTSVTAISPELEQRSLGLV